MTEPIDPNTLSPGTIRRGPEAGRRGTGKFVVTACIDCGAQRWVQHIAHKGGGMYREPERCKACHLKNGKYNVWRGG
jgi:hypothetical protein